MDTSTTGNTNIDVEGPTVGLTIFLLRNDRVEDFRSKVITASDPLPLLPPLDGVFLALPGDEREPGWVGDVRPLVSGTVTPLFSRSPAALITVGRNQRTFVLTFGHAWQKLKDQWLEKDFGRRVALNAVSRQNVVGIHAEQVFAKWHLASERAPRASSVREFGVKFDRDFVAVLEGVPSFKALGATLRGGTNLRLHVPTASLNEVLDLLTTLFESDSYQRQWPEVDNVEVVADGALTAELDGILDVDLATGKAQKSIVLFTPVHRRDQMLTADSYIFGRLSKNAATTPYLTIGGWTSMLEKAGKKASVAESRRSPIRILDENKETVSKSTVYDCFGYEVAYNGNQFVLSSGTWYAVVSKFIQRINALVKNIPAPKLSLPKWNEREREGEFNARCCKALKLLHFDAKNMNFGGGHSQLEFCDIFDAKSKTLLFAKIASKSSGMSHLLEQVRRTSELLFSTDPAYRKELSELFKKQHPKAARDWLTARPHNGEWELCLVSLGRPAEKLPFSLGADWPASITS